MKTVINDQRPELLMDYPSVVEVPVQWSDQDAFGHVNNAKYLTWFETSRIVYVKQCGMGHFMDNSKIGPILASATCNYRQQVAFPNDVLVGTRVSRVGRRSFTMEHRILSRDADGVVADGQSIIVMFDYEKQESVYVPEELRNAFDTFEGSSAESTSKDDEA
tara:strand:+ start:1727 stop:2212 length:486 start_codon:yes stop_codon:yes gene_type:complete